MKLLKTNLIGTAFAAGFFAFAHAQPVYGQDTPPEKSQALLQKVKQGELDRRIAIKQTEIERLNQDLDKSKKDMDTLQKNLDATAALMAESNGNLDQLGDARKRLEQTLNLTLLQIEAEQKKGAGLKSLSEAQSRALDAINQRMAELDVRSQVRQSEVQLLSAGKPVPGEDADETGSPELSKLKKSLAANELKTLTADKIARDAMKAASAKLQLADEAAARVDRMSEQTKKGNLAPVGEQAGDTTPTVTSTPAAAAKPKEQKAEKPKATPTPAPLAKTATPKAKILNLFP